LTGCQHRRIRTVPSFVPTHAQKGVQDSLIATDGIGGIAFTASRHYRTAAQLEIAQVLSLPTNLCSDPSLRQRLEREAKAVSKLSHPHICTLRDKHPR
jgi:hypothetical protein